MTLKDLVRGALPFSVRNWLRSPRRSLNYIGARLSFLLGRVSCVELRPGLVLRCHPISLKAFDVFRTDQIQRRELDDFLHHCQPGMRLLDLGAHFGFFALVAATRFKASVVCVEASAGAVATLRTNVRLNHAEESIRIINVAAGAEDGYVEMLATGPAAQDYFVSPLPNVSETVRVRQMSLPTLIAEGGLMPTHIKIDIEGFEVQVLGGARDVLHKLRPIIFLELHGDLINARGENPEAIVALLLDLGYRFKQSGRSLLPEEVRACGFNSRFTCLPAG
jgi:FkbM family methyltransferase